MNGEPDWGALRVLLAVAERGGFSAAARALAISQPTVSRRVDELERAFGTRLLVRRSRGAVATPAGERVLAEVRRMAEGAAAARAAVDGASSRRACAVSATEGLGTLWLPRHLAALRAAAPGVRLELIVDNLNADLSARHADVAVRLARPRQPDLVVRRVGTLGFGFFASPAYLAARGAPRRLGDLRRHDHVGFAPRPAAPPLPPHLRWLQGLAPPERFAVASSNLVAMIELARAGHGIMLGALAAVGDDPGLVRVLPRARPPAMGIWLAAHADVRRDPTVRQIFDALAALFAREAPALAG